MTDETKPNAETRPSNSGGSGRKRDWRKALFTYYDEPDAGHLYYFAPQTTTPGPYLKQRRVTAIVDIASDGSFAGVELIDGMPPLNVVAETDAAASGDTRLLSGVSSDPLSQTPAQSDDVREALRLAADVLSDMISCGHIVPMGSDEPGYPMADGVMSRIAAALQPQPNGGKPIPLDKGKGGSEKT